MSNKKIKWGIISTGWIASCFAKALNGVKDAEIVAVASRNIDKANEFADKYKIAKRYSSYEELAKDSDIDIVYIATPHSHHKANAILCLNNNKNILVEKAFTLNAKEAKEVIELARSKNLFVMEAMWTRFFPASKKVKELLQNKTIGDIHYVNGDLSFNAFMDGRADMDGRLFNPDLAGGALLDVGIYPISYASFVFGAQPVAFESTVHKTTTGVDERFNLFFKYENGATAFLTGSFQSIAPREVTIVGSLGYIRIPDFFCPKQVILKVKTEAEQVFNFPWPEDYPASYDQNGLFYEAEAVTKYILDGKKESDVISPDETIKLMETLDSIRAKWGIKYPGEN